MEACSLLSSINFAGSEAFSGKDIASESSSCFVSNSVICSSTFLRRFSFFSVWLVLLFCCFQSSLDSVSTETEEAVEEVRDAFSFPSEQYNPDNFGIRS